MPFAILLEVVLQPCGWLAAYLGSALTSEVDLHFRNLGGTAIQYEAVDPSIGTFTTVVELTRVSSSGGMIIQNYDFATRSRGRLIYAGDTSFGFFSGQALAEQVGLLGVEPYRPSPSEAARASAFIYPRKPPFAEDMLRMIDQIELFVPDGGPAKLGFVRGTKEVSPSDWFFAAHFYQDPVWPGSLGLEGFLQLLEVVATERWGSDSGTRFRAMTPGREHHWRYRGQVIPTDERVVVEAVVTEIDDRERLVRADGFLSIDGRLIYEMRDFTLSALGGLP